MELTPLLIYESFILAIGVAAVGAFALFYFRLLKGYNELRLDHEKLKEELDAYGKVVSATSKDHIAKLVAHSEELSEELKQQLSALLSEQAKKEAGAYEDVVKKVGEDLGKESEKQVAEFVSSLQKEVKESEEEVTQKISKLYEEVQQESDTMKASMKQNLQEHIYAIVQDVVKQSTGRLLTKEDHEGIVLSSLEESMKRHGV